MRPRPLSPIPAPLSRPHAAPLSSAGLGARAARILVVEDNRVNRMVLGALLKPLAPEVVMVENGLDAVRAAGERPFDLILMDIHMPVLDGLAATRQIRADEAARPGGQRTAIVVTTANAMAHQRDAYRAAGMDACLAKPLRRDELFRAMADLMAADPRNV